LGQRAHSLTRSLARRDKNCISFPEGADLCRGIYGSVHMPALSVDSSGTPFFNLPEFNDDQKERFPLLEEQKRLSGLVKLNVSDVRWHPATQSWQSEHTLSARIGSLLQLTILDIDSFTSCSRTRARR